MISIIVAASENNVIGVQGDLPWRLPADLRHFRETTMGKPIVMGRKTWESIGKPLPGRQNIVISRQAGFMADGCDVVASVDEAMVAAGGAQEVMVIGGSEIYALFLAVASRVCLTRVHVKVTGDVLFPRLDEDDWRLVSDEPHVADELNEFAYSFRIYERRGRSGR